MIIKWWAFITGNQAAKQTINVFLYIIIFGCSYQKRYLGPLTFDNYLMMFITVDQATSADILLPFLTKQNPIFRAHDAL